MPGTRTPTAPAGPSPEPRRGSPEERDQIGVRYSRELGRWTGPFVMAAVNTRVVRRSNALLGYPWGRDFLYSEVSSFEPGMKGMLSAASLSAGLGAFLAATRVPVLPQAGEEEASVARLQAGEEEARVAPQAAARKERKKERTPRVEWAYGDATSSRTALLAGANTFRSGWARRGSLGLLVSGLPLPLCSNSLPSAGSPSLPPCATVKTVLTFSAAC